jgi:hypothetical protein
MVLELAKAENLTVQWFKGSEKVEKSENVKSVRSGDAFKLDFKVSTSGKAIRGQSRNYRV